MILVYISKKEICDFECDSIEELKETIVNFYSSEENYFSGISRLENEDGGLIGEDLETLNEELNDRIDQAKKDLSDNDMSDINKDYWNNSL